MYVLKIYLYNTTSSEGLLYFTTNNEFVYLKDIEEKNRPHKSKPIFTEKLEEAKKIKNREEYRHLCHNFPHIFFGNYGLFIFKAIEDVLQIDRSHQKEYLIVVGQQQGDN